MLAELAADYPLPATILAHRSLAKLKGTYTDKLPLMVNPATGRVHTSYGQAVAVTGRLASNDPNLQNIPIRTPEGRRVREAFVAPPGHTILSADYSQIELRIMAHISEDPALLRAFSERIDVHRATAAEVFNVALADVSSEQRRYARSQLRADLRHGASAGDQPRIDNRAARDYIERYFERFAACAVTWTTAPQRARTRLRRTVFGRRLWLPRIKRRHYRARPAPSVSDHAPMQGTAADLIKLAMIAVQRRSTPRAEHQDVMQVPDELVLEVPDAEVYLAREAIPRLMAGVSTLKVPLLPRWASRHWDQAH